MTEPETLDRKGLTLAVAAYAIWGLLPLYFHALQSVAPTQLLAHRVVWSVVLLAIIVVAMGRVRTILSAARGKTLLLLCASALLIATNWLVYIWAAHAGHILEASLGYFINPLVNVALGVAVLGERLRRMQGIAIAVAAAGVLVMAVSGGAAIGVPITLALSFGFYGLLRKIAAIDALGGLTVETFLLLPFAIGWLVYSGSNGGTGFGQSTTTDLLIVAAGVITTTPLLLFAAAARRLALSTLGLIQYLAPSMQFGIGLALGEPLQSVHLITFPLIWLGCAIYAWDTVRAARPSPVPALE
jgi:chloramphenicol-sensitive protein RarD